MTTPALTSHRGHLGPLVPVLLPLACLVWAFWTTLAELAQVWSTNPQYSHGWLVPVFAAFLLWSRRDRLEGEPLRPGLVGLLILAAGLAMRLAGTYWHYVSLEQIALVPCIAGLVWLAGGWRAWRWAWPAVLFLLFMIPLPYFLAVAMSGPLQRFATVVSTFIMQTMGLPALAEGNVILLNDHEIGIVEACSGLRMLVVFIALSTAVVLVSPRHWVDRTIILVSSIPIALASNVLRVTATGVMYEMGHSEMAATFFHDVAGWLMMPLALGMLWVELRVLSALFINAPPRVPASTRRPAPPRPTMPRPRRTQAIKPASRERDRQQAPEQETAQKR
jgi:exosortase